MHPLLLAGAAGLGLYALTRKKEAPPVTSAGGAPASSSSTAAAPSGGGGGAAQTVAQVAVALAPVVPAIVGGAGATAAGAAAATSATATAGASGAAAGGTAAVGAGTAAGVGNVTLASGGLAGGALIGGAVAVTAVGALAGSQLGSGTMFGVGGGALAGALTQTVGLPALAGAQVGKEIHRLFGGDGVSFTASNFVIQMGAAAAGGLAAVLGGAALIGFAPLVLAVFGVVSAIEDANRLAHGQAGALRDFMADFNAGRALFLQRIRALATEATSDDVAMYATAAAWGWANIKNSQKRAAWAAKPRGLGQSEASHMQWGKDRGYWYAYPTGSVDAAFFKPNEVISSETRATAAGYGSAFTNARIGGQVAANVANYQWAMKQPRGLGKNDYQHAVYWKQYGYFFGDLATNGDLVYGGQTWSWR